MLEGVRGYQRLRAAGIAIARIDELAEALAEHRRLVDAEVPAEGPAVHAMVVALGGAATIGRLAESPRLGAEQGLLRITTKSEITVTRRWPSHEGGALVASCELPRDVGATERVELVVVSRAAFALYAGPK